MSISQYPQRDQSAVPTNATWPSALNVRHLALMVMVVMLTGVGAGLGGMFLALLLHGIQHLAYGYSLDQIISSETFLMGVSAAPGGRRMLILGFCGLLAGVGWWVLYRVGRPLVGIKQATASDAPLMPPVATLAHVLLQIGTVGLGSPLGREVAPRELGALMGGWLSHAAGLSPEQRRTIVACGAGAGLAAVYNVPLGGAVFVLEVLLATLSWPAAIMALATSAIAASVAWMGLGAESQYVVAHFPLSAGLITWSLLTSPLFGLAAYGFARLSAAARRKAARGWRLPVFALINFLIIGCMAVWLPQLLGNGKGPAQLGFSSLLTVGMAGMLLICKVAITTSTLRAGAQGGLLTPGLSNGALMAVVLGGLWSQIWPGVPMGAYAVIGAAAFLASSMSMPLTAIVLITEFTRIDHDFLVPIVLAVAGSFGTSQLCALWARR
ncbi:chloride channel protein [Acerihabitans sp. TG2]|uniref:chloride channel protein n=1 Tax=Acerihabitans sp. TG2 TaxID=3096008 RepID=UPI002B23644E|nr:chloride channel protein [Acerihabitans sp. TG2]MEA9390705.1 chloride channel protein [Acerihabitans sp. TG2]